MLEHKKEYATILAFDVKLTREAEAVSLHCVTRLLSTLRRHLPMQAAQSLGVRIFSADIIYHLTDMFDKYLKDTVAAKQAAGAAEAVYPCICKIIPTAIFNKRDPIVVGVDVMEGKLKVCCCA